MWPGSFVDLCDPHISTYQKKNDIKYFRENYPTLIGIGQEICTLGPDGQIIIHDDIAEYKVAKVKFLQVGSGIYLLTY